MKKFTPLFTSAFLVEAPAYPESATPVVRYSDYCAHVQELEQLRANAVRRCDFLLRELERVTAQGEVKSKVARW